MTDDKKFTDKLLKINAAMSYLREVKFYTCVAVLDKLVDKALADGTQMYNAAKGMQPLTGNKIRTGGVAAQINGGAAGSPSTGTAQPKTYKFEVTLTVHPDYDAWREGNVQTYLEGIIDENTDDSDVITQYTIRPAAVATASRANKGTDDGRRFNRFGGPRK